MQLLIKKRVMETHVSSQSLFRALKRVHLKSSFNGNTRINRLISILNGEVKRIICAIGSNGVLDTYALKALKKVFGNLYTVSYLKLKNILELPSIFSGDNKGVRHFNQQFKGAVTWLNSLGYVSFLKPTQTM